MKTTRIRCGDQDTNGWGPAIGKDEAKDGGGENDESKDDGKHNVGDDRKTGKRPEEIKPSDYGDYGER